jgi:hypothetical protein
MFSPGRLTAYRDCPSLAVCRVFSTITACKAYSPSKPEQSRYAVNHSKPDSNIRLCESGGNEENFALLPPVFSCECLLTVFIHAIFRLDFCNTGYIDVCYGRIVETTT